MKSINPFRVRRFAAACGLAAAAAWSWPAYASVTCNDLYIAEADYDAAVNAANSYNQNFEEGIAYGDYSICMDNSRGDPMTQDECQRELDEDLDYIADVVRELDDAVTNAALQVQNVYSQLNLQNTVCS